jgi:hypothetical protein
MNRAWIPAGALAGVSVAGLLALGPLTDSMSTKPPIPDRIAAPAPITAKTTEVPVSLDYATQGRTETAALTKPHGGKAVAARITTNSDIGQVALRSSKKASAPVKQATTAKKKKAAPRQTSIGTSGESSNSDSGLTGSGSSAATQLGEQGTTLGSDAP